VRFPRNLISAALVLFVAAAAGEFSRGFIHGLGSGVGEHFSTELWGKLADFFATRRHGETPSYAESIYYYDTSTPDYSTPYQPPIKRNSKPESKTGKQDGIRNKVYDYTFTPDSTPLRRVPGPQTNKDAGGRSNQSMTWHGISAGYSEYTYPSPGWSEFAYPSSAAS
jgi:hypothetical protein